MAPLNKLALWSMIKMNGRIDLTVFNFIKKGEDAKKEKWVLLDFMSPIKIYEYGV